MVCIPKINLKCIESRKRERERERETDRQTETETERQRGRQRERGEERREESYVKKQMSDVAKISLFSFL